VITSADTPPTPPEQGGVLPPSWYLSPQPEDTRDHASEMMAAHGANWPPIAVQDVTHGVGLPSLDRG
jgi:hypothetical protein